MTPKPNLMEVKLFFLSLFLLTITWDETHSHCYPKGKPCDRHSHNFESFL